VSVEQSVGVNDICYIKKKPYSSTMVSVWPNSSLTEPCSALGRNFVSANFSRYHDDDGKKA